MEAQVILSQISRLKNKHRDLDRQIEQQERLSISVNPIELQRLKKLKLSIKDQIVQLQASQVPNISA